MVVVVVQRVALASDLVPSMMMFGSSLVIVIGLVVVFGVIVCGVVVCGG